MNSERTGGIIALIASIKPCCILLWALSLIGASGGPLSTIGPAIEMIIVPFVALPALLLAHYKIWKGLRWCLAHRAKSNWRMVGVNIAVVLLSTIVFAYFLVTDYVPNVRAATMQTSPQSHEHMHH